MSMITLLGNYEKMKVRISNSTVCDSESVELLNFTIDI